MTCSTPFNQEIQKNRAYSNADCVARCLPSVRRSVRCRACAGISIFLLGALLTPLSIVFAEPPPGNWTLTLNEDFDGTSLNSFLWNTGMRWTDRINNELQAYRPENVTVANGMCTIKVEKRPASMMDMNGYQWPAVPVAGTFDYASGAIQTYNKWAQTYGYFEARVRMAGGKGNWPAFWLLPDRGPQVTPLDRRVEIGDNGYGMGNEFDIFEYMGTWKNPTTGLSTMHSGLIWKYNQSGGSFGDYTMVNQLTNPDTEFHTYGMYWGPGLVVFYIDGRAVLSKNHPTNISNVPQYLILNCALHLNDWTGTPLTKADIDADLPRTMDIDYVRVYSGTAIPFTTYEVENVASVASSSPITVMTDSGPSNGAYHIVNTQAPNDYITYTLTVSAPGNYTVHAGVKRADGRAQCQLSVDGANQGPVQDLYSSSPGFVALGPISVTFATAGDKTFKFTVTGKNASSAGYRLAFDYIRLYPETPSQQLTYEIEDISNFSSTNIVTPMPDSLASNGAYEMLQANAVNNNVIYTVPISSPGTYPIYLGVKRAANRGQLQLSIDGVNQGAVQDLYKSTSDFVALSLGEKVFSTAGNKAFKFTVTGKNTGSTGYLLGLDYIRLSTVEAPTTLFEAENIATAVSSDVVTLMIDSSASNGAYEMIQSDTPNDYITYTIPLPTAGTYSVRVRVKRAASRGQCRLAIDGVNQGAVQDLYKSTEDFVELDLGSKTFATSGDKAFKFTVIGKNASSSGYRLAIDYIRLSTEPSTETPPQQVTHEVELLTVATFSDPVSQISETPASGGLYHILSANATNDEITYVVPITAPGTYNIAVRVKKVNTRGIFQLSVDGVNVGAPQDLYAPTASFTVLNVGSVYFPTGGAKAFKFTVAGKNASSSGYTLALDAIQLQ